MFRTRLRVTRLDGRELFLEFPQWTPSELRGVYPIGWPRSVGQDTAVVVPRDSIRSIARLESNRGLTLSYIAGVMAIAAVAATR